jgi:two-component system phosphate regulon sensor histidine kinase PhoR
MNLGVPETDESHARAQQAALFASMSEGVLVLDEAGRVQMANRAFTQLFDLASDPVGKTLIETLRVREILDLVAEATQSRQALERELRLSGLEERWLQINASPITDPDGRWLGTILLFHDLTRLKQFERARQEFVANVSHELRTPLSHIRGYVETLLSGATSDPTVSTRFLQTIERNTDRLQLLIEDLLTISELESGRVSLNLQAVSLRSVAGKVFDDFKTRAEARTVTLTNELPDLTVYADTARIEQVLSNLVDNAIKYGRAGGQVIVSALMLPEDTIEVSVRDDGPGLPPEALERIFERFYRVDKARSREQGGTGLGLSIVKHIVQSHGGRVWARSEPGNGANFYFTLPRAARGRSCVTS